MTVSDICCFFSLGAYAIFLHTTTVDVVICVVVKEGTTGACFNAFWATLALGKHNTHEKYYNLA